jgi:Tol biopolymer transport system component
VRPERPLLPGRHVSFESDEFWFAVSADGAQVAYRAQQDLPTYELYHAPVDGRTAPVKVNPTLALGPPPGDVTDAKVSPDGRWVVYLADQEVDQRFELYSVPSAAERPSSSTVRCGRRAR